MTATRVRLEEAAERRFLDAFEAGPVDLTWDTPPPQVGDLAPDAELLDHEGVPRRLSSVWADRPALVLFWRHFGCGCGLARAAALREELDDLRSAGAEVAVVGMGEPERASHYRADQRLDVPILCDPDRRLYRAFGLRHGTPAQVLFDAPPEFWDHPRGLGEELATARREGGRPLVDDPWMLPGEFVVGTDGRLRLAYRYQYCEDLPDPQVLTAAIRLA